jgi:hypothetical protein
VSSPYVRCVETVAPLAEDRGLAIEEADELAVERMLADGPAFLAGLVQDDAVACVHGGMQRALGYDVRFRKGAVWRFAGSLERPEILA